MSHLIYDQHGEEFRGSIIFTDITLWLGCPREKQFLIVRCIGPGAHYFLGPHDLWLYCANTVLRDHTAFIIVDYSPLSLLKQISCFERARHESRGYRTEKFLSVVLDSTHQGSCLLLFVVLATASDVEESLNGKFLSQP